MDVAALASKIVERKRMGMIPIIIHLSSDIEANMTPIYLPSVEYAVDLIVECLSPESLIEFYHDRISVFDYRGWCDFYIFNKFEDVARLVMEYNN
jgi:hypothetical protein